VPCIPWTPQSRPLLRDLIMTTLPLVFESYSLQPIARTVKRPSSPLSLSLQPTGVKSSSPSASFIGRLTGATRSISQPTTQAMTRPPVGPRHSSSACHLPPGKRTLINPISWLFSRKHCRQMFSPYLRIRPALWVQTRLVRQHASAEG